MDFARALIENESLGRDQVPDYLSVSLSSTDYVGHMFRPSSLEAEDNILRLDRTLAALLRFVDARVGLDRTLVVLCADHGVPEVPGYLRELGFESDYVVPDEFDKDAAIAALKQSFGIGEALIQTYFHPYIYLNRAKIAEKGLDQAEVERAVAEEVSRFDGVALAVPSSGLRTGQVPDTPLIRSVLRNFSPNRSGDIYLVFAPNRFINDFGSTTVATTHGSPCSYDGFVPLIFAGMGLPAKRVARRIHTVSVAPTLSMLLRAKLPSGSFAAPLQEVMIPR